MYPDLSYILHAAFGTRPDSAPASFIKTFGLFMALAFLTAAYALFLELRRKAQQGLLTTSEMKGEKKGTTVSVYPHERVGDITMVAAFSGLFGAKMFAIFESSENLNQFLANPIGEFFSPGGLAIYGGLICGFIGVFIYVKRWLKIKPIYVMDAVAPALMFAYGVGRIGCQLSGDGDWGIPNKLAQPTWWFLPKWTWAFDYPNNVTNSSRTPHEIIAGFQGIYNTHLTEPVFPTPFYETILAFMIGGFLWSIRKRLKVPGTLFMIYLILNGLERFFIEKIRVNDKISAFGIQFTQAELIAVLLFITGIIGIIVLNSRANKTIDIKAV
jgi:phosphatidylglycerol---prolipoprotein diacylglyceryl transferase